MFGTSRSTIRALGQGNSFCAAWNAIEGKGREALDLANNCYSYAVGNLPAIVDTDKRTSEISAPQPGDASGLPKHILVLLQHKSLSFWIKLAERDGLKRLDVPKDALLPELGPGHRLVALVYSMRRHDYHWLRQEGDGLWSHKRGRHAPISHDFSRQLIVDPRRADLGDYDAPPVFFAVPKMGIEVRMKPDWLAVFHQFEDYLTGNIPELRRHSWIIANLVKRDLPRLSDYVADLAGHGPDDQVYAFWRHLADGDRLPNADALSGRGTPPASHLANAY